MNEQHDRSIITAIRKMTRTDKSQELKLTSGTVLSVDSNKRTCVVELPNYVDITCKLMAETGDGVLIKPTVGSTVLITYATYTDAYVLLMSDVDEVSFKGTENGGLVKVIQLIDVINDIQNKVNELISTFNSHTHTSGGSGSPTTPPTTPISGTLTITNRSDVENTAVKHGN